jgi:hypothetical protein
MCRKEFMAVATKTSAPVGSARRTDRVALTHQLAPDLESVAPKDDPVPFGDERGAVSVLW